MPNAVLTEGNDTYVQTLALYQAGWFEVIALGGNDTITVYGHQVQPGAGNDRVEHVPLPDGNWAWLTVAYWGSPNGVRVDLVQGTAQDGWGGTDTLIRVDQIGASDRSDWILGNERDNYFYPQFGTDTIDGGAGQDGLRLNWGGFAPSDGSAVREPLFGDLALRVSADGRQATVSATGRNGLSFQYLLSNVEFVDGRDVLDGPERRLVLADMITPQVMAEDAIAAGGSLRWNAQAALGTAATVSFSFVTTAPSTGVGAAGFRTFSEGERALVRSIFAQTAALTGLSFNEVVESGGTVGQIRFGVSQQSASKGQAYLPNQPGVGDQAGDVWMDVESMVGLAPDGEGYQALLHEIGHSLGLRHPRNVDPGDNWAVQLREADDRHAWSVMSGAPSADGLFRADWGLLDVFALRYLYGTRAVATGNDRYTLDVAAGNRQFTITDDGGIDTLDASALISGVQLTLVPGSTSDVGVSNAGIFGVDNLGITVGTVIEHAIGTAADDELIGNSADNSLTGGLGNDWIDGGAGTDTAVFAGGRAAYEIDHAFGFTYVRARDGTSGFDTLVNIERLQFADQVLVLGTGVPLSEDVNVAVDEDTPYAGSLPLPEGITNRAAATWSLVGTAASGSASVAANGSFSYTPAANFWGSDSFGYRVSTSGGQTTYRVYVEVKPVNDGAPVGRSQALMLTPGQAWSAQVPAASDVDGDPLSYAVTGEPAHGALAFTGDGRYTYTPAAGWYGDDSVVYSVSDGMGGSNVYTITLRVGLRTAEDQSLGTALPDPADGARAAASYHLVSGPTRGQASVSAQGELSWTPQPNAHGLDNLSYEVVVGSVATRIAVALKIDSVNDGPPASSAVTYNLLEDAVLSVQLPPAIDPDGDTVVYSLVAEPTRGSASVSPGGALLYTPLANTFGSDSMSFRVTDAEGVGRDYVVSLNVAAQNDAPVAAPASATLAAGQSLVGLLPAAADAEGDRVTYTLAMAPAKGRVTVSGVGFYTYVPNVGASGSDSFSYTVRDGQGGSNSYAVTLALQPAAASLSTELTPMLAQAAARVATAPLPGLRLNSGPDNDTLVGGEGLDLARWAGRRADHELLRSGDSLIVRDTLATDGDAGTDQLRSVERLIFSDQVLAFGARAEEVARVAFALWTPEIGSSTTLFAFGLGFYDRGADFDALCRHALQFWPQQGEDYAALLQRHSGSTLNAAQLLATMDAAGGGEAGRVAALTAVAWDANTTAQLHATGLINHGVLADRVVPGHGDLFAALWPVAAGG